MSGKTKFSRRQVVTALSEMLESGVSVTKVARILANYLIEARLVRQTELYLRDIELMMAEKFNITTAYVYSARPLSQQIEKKVKEFVKEATSTRDVETIAKVDPSLIGGIVIKTADAELDCSVRTKLQKLRSI